ncbi:GGDEF domain-containing protein [Dechloromonas sp. ZY10]|uniref:EAL domain-containing protein n=1 Tax=Dechloromonas aquae TaxID=2664436 RepID=UPI003527FDA9
MYRARTDLQSIESSFFKLPDTLLLVFDRDWSLSLVSDAWAGTLGRCRDEMLQGTFLDLLHDEDRADCAARLTAMDADSPTLRFASRCQRQDGSFLGVAWNIRYDSDDALYYASAHETAVNLQGNDARLPDMFVDSLTGLPNRSLFVERLEHTQHRARRRSIRYAVLYCGIDRFKVVNQSLGHRQGDLLLMAVANLLYSTIRPTDMVARMAGDEFALLLEDIRDVSSTLHVVNRIQQKLVMPFMLDKHEVYCTVSFGIAAGNDKGAEELLGDANIAMIGAKALGGGGYVVFDKQMHDQAVHRLELEMDLRRAVERDEFQAYFQPIIGLADRQLSGFEALVRWQHPEKGLISPADFIPVAEETGMIVPIGRRMLYAACRQAAQWNRNLAGKRPLSVSVNLAARQMQHPDLLADIASALNDSGLPPELLKLEITESSMMANPEQAIDLLRQLKAMGIRLMLDDFGTGYSSLSYLHRLPIDTLKIDRSFVRNVHQNDNDRHFIETIIGLAHKLGHDLVCEGIEQACQAEILAGLGVEYGQGFLYSRPVAAHEAEMFILTSRDGCQPRQAEQSLTF